MKIARQQFQIVYKTANIIRCNIYTTFTRCLHFTANFTAGRTTGWVNCANEPSQAALERSSQDADDVNRLTHSKAAVWTVDDVARLIIEFLKKEEYSYSFVYFFTLGSMIVRGDNN